MRGTVARVSIDGWLFDAAQTMGPLRGARSRTVQEDKC